MGWQVGAVLVGGYGSVLLLSLIVIWRRLADISSRINTIDMLLSLLDGRQDRMEVSLFNIRRQNDTFSGEDGGHAFHSPSISVNVDNMSSGKYAGSFAPPHSFRFDIPFGERKDPRLQIILTIE